MGILVIALRNLWRRTVRTIIALLGIAVGVSIVISIISSAGGLRYQFYRMAEEFRGDLIVTQSFAFVPMQSQISFSGADKLEGQEDVAGVSLVRIWRQPVKNSEELEQPVMTLGLRAGDISPRRDGIAAGRGLEEGDTGVVLIGELLARDLGMELGSTIDVLGRKFKICGLFRSPVASVSFLSGGIIMPLDVMCKILAPESPPAGNMAIVHVKGSLDVGRRPSNEALSALDARVASVAEKLGEQYSTLKIQPIQEYLDSFKSQLEVIDQFAWAISLLAVFAGGIGIMNTMIMSVFERTREIGLLRALGWPRRMIMMTIVTEGGLLALLGGLVGIPLGLLEVKLATFLIKLGWIEVIWDWVLFGEAMLLAAVVGILGSIYPAARAASFAPTEALRYE